MVVIKKVFDHGIVHGFLQGFGFTNIFARRALSQFWSFRIRCTTFLNPTFLGPEDQEIRGFYVVRQRCSTDFEAPNL